MAKALNLGEADFARIEARHVRRADDPYLVLGAAREMSDGDLKRHYRQLVAETHPDPSKALSDGPNAWPLDKMEALLETLLALDSITKKNGFLESAL